MFAAEQLRPTPGTGPRAASRHTPRILARRIPHLTDENTAVDACAPKLLDLYGVGPDTAAALLTAVGETSDRLAGEASFAAFRSARPVEASSGKTQRRRLNRGGDRQANAELRHRHRPPGLGHPHPFTTWHDGSLRARHGAKASGAKSATSPVRSTTPSSHPDGNPRHRPPPVDIHKGHQTRPHVPRHRHRGCTRHLAPHIIGRRAFRSNVLETQALSCR
ncbi:transposase [Streptomyces sp. IMTB 2501]|uniref:transposase n=1 Tax=Streptomyces sp. IMTB 2501 TaxID=1776340 RepID=UPI000D1A37C0|nr:transposase [Streptomyces sp. IMTB 2501]